MAKKRSKSPKRSAVAHDVSPLNSSIVAITTTADEAGDNDNAADDSAGNHDVQRQGNTDSRSVGDGGGRNKPRAMAPSKLSEEAALTARLFGGGDGASAGGGAAAWMDDDDDVVVESNKQQDDDVEGEGNNSGWSGGDELFAIDRSGEEVTDDVEEDETETDGQQQTSDDYQGLDDEGSDDDVDDSGEESVEELENENKASMGGAAWQDSDSEDSDSDDSDDESEDGQVDNNESNDERIKKQKGVSLVNGPNRLKKLRRYRDETDPLSFKEYELRLRERFMNTSSVAARTDWADVGLAQKQLQDTEEGEPQKKKKRGYGSSSEDESDDEECETSASKILASNASLFETSHSGLPLPPTLLNVVRTRDGNLSDPNSSVVNCTQFHPGSDEENPLLMTAGMDKMLRFFRVDGEDNPKIHGIQFDKLPIRCASFLGDSGSVILSGRRPFFYSYDAISGNVTKIPSILGREERSLEKFVVSKDGKMIAFVGNDGYVIIVDGESKRWICDLKMNGSVRAIEFSGCGEYVLGSGSDGDVYR